MIDPHEIQARLYDQSSGLAERIGRDVGLYSVALLSVTGSREGERLDFCGSGSLVSVGDSDYILTAAHVWESFEHAAGLGLTLDREDVDHRFFISIKSIVPLGPENTYEQVPRGPDMTLLKIPREQAAELKKVKRFYPLAVDIPEPPNVNSLEVWILMGSPGEQSTKAPKHASLTMNGIFATIRSEHSYEGYGYFDLEMDITFPGIPRSFRGVSGGGFWSVLVYGSADGQLHWFLTLVGIACWQLPLVDNIRLVRCLGARSIRSLISNVEEIGKRK